MSILLFTVLIFPISILAGLLGSLTGLGGGVVITPALILLFHIPLPLALGASLISVIATSSGTTAAYLRDGYTNLRIGMFLETGAVIGALLGAFLLISIPKTVIAILFSLVMFFSSWLTLKRRNDYEVHTASHPLATFLKLNDTYPLHGESVPYSVQGVPLALAIMGAAGLLSGLLGLGSGTLKVLAMDQAMRLPYKVATTTSNFMMGITAAVSAGVYFSNGYIDPLIAFPVMLGVLIGAKIGTTLLMHMHTHLLRLLFSIAISLIGIEMLYQALTGQL